MGMGPEFSSDSNAEHFESFAQTRVRVLFVVDRSLLAASLRGALEKSLVEFEIVVEPVLDRAAERIERERFDLLLLDLALAEIRRSVLVDRASALASRLPVVALSGTESIDPGLITNPRSLAELLDEADLAAVLHRTLRRARRLGTFALAPVFCRLERFGA